MSEVWDQRVFNQTLEELLKNCESKTWPRTLNKKALFVSVRTLGNTPSIDKAKIEHELGLLTSHPLNSTAALPKAITVGLAIASKRASKSWVGQGNLSGYSKKEKAKALRQLSLSNWRKMVGQKLASMIRGRGASTAFIKSGWVKCIQALGPKVGGKYDRSGGRGVKVRGAAKGTVSLAEPGRLQVVITNTAASRSDHGGFLRNGEPALQKALRDEEAQTREYLDDMKDDIEHFNRQQH